MADDHDVGYFLERVMDNEMPAYWMSDPVPETNDKAVKVAVGTTFKEVT
jgi:hypothetical protein